MLTSHASPAVGVWVHFILRHLCSLCEHTDINKDQLDHRSDTLYHVAECFAALYQSQHPSESLLVTAVALD